MTEADWVGCREFSAGSLWTTIQGRLREEFGDAIYSSWFAPISFDQIEGENIKLKVPTRFMRDWILTHYSERIRSLCSVADPSIRRISVSVDVAPTMIRHPLSTGSKSPPQTSTRAFPPLPQRVPLSRTDSVAPQGVKPSSSPKAGKALYSSPEPHGSPSSTEHPASQETPAPASASHRGDFSAPLDPRYTFDGFITGQPNEFAYAAAQRMTDSERPTFNPLFLYGGVGLGKTHLMHAIAHAIQVRHPRRRVVYLSAEKFMYSFVRALKSRDTFSFKEALRSVDVLMIDDVQFISGKESTQEEFFHTFNALIDQGKQIVISADRSPADLDDIGDRLRSRLSSGLVADIHPTTYELRLSILSKKALSLGVEVPDSVLEFLAHRISSNVRELEGALTRLVAHAQLVGRTLSLETAQDVLKDILRANDKRVTIDDIQRKVAEHFHLRVTDMQSARRSRSIARPRQVAMFLSKHLTSRSLPEIGRRFGGRDHTTVIHAVKKVSQLMEADQSFAEDVFLLRGLLEG